MFTNNYHSKPRRRGTVVVLVVFSLGMLMAFAALVVDIGYVHSVRDELQRSADAAAMAACWELGEEFANGSQIQDITLNVRTEAETVAGINDVANATPELETADVVLGYLSDEQFSVRDSTLDTSDAMIFNAVHVNVQRTTQTNGQIDTFFGRVFGINGLDAEASATAAIVRHIEGFETPADASNIMILPFALDEVTWNDLLNGGGTDLYSYNPDSKVVSGGSDTKREVNLYPQGTGSPGNRGTVDIGSSNNSTVDIKRQITDGISPADFAALGKPLKFDGEGEVILNGDTGISAGVKSALASIIGQPRCIPIFREVNGPGNNAEFTIVCWAGVRIMDVKLTGAESKKHLTVQPACISTRGVIPGTPVTGQSDYVYSRSFLVK